MHAVALELGRALPNAELRLAFLEFVYLMGIIWDVDLEKEFLKEPDKYEGRVQRVSATDRSGSFGERGNSFVLVFVVVDEFGGFVGCKSTTTV